MLARQQQEGALAAMDIGVNNIDLDVSAFQSFQGRLVVRRPGEVELFTRQKGTCVF
jgi:hypothetical protein